MSSRSTTVRNAFYEALGKFIANWASMETALDVLALMTRHLLRTEPPSHQLEAKLRYVRKHLLPSVPSDERVRLAMIFDRIQSLAAERHDLIHGAGMLEERDGKTFAVTLGRLLQPGNKPRRKPTRVTTEQIIQRTDEVYAIWGALLDFAEAAAKGQLVLKTTPD